MPGTAKNSDDSGEPVNPVNRRLRKYLYWGAGSIVLISGLLLLLPVAAALVAQSWLQQQGAEAASIEDIDFNPFTGKLVLTNLQAGGDAGERAHIGSAEVDIRWWPLTARRIHVEAIRINDVQLDISVDPSGPLQAGKIILPAASDALAREPAADSSPWGFGSDLVALSNITIGYRDSRLNTEVVIHELMLGTQANWAAEQSTPLVVDVAIDGAPFILESNIVPWAATRELTGSLQLDALDLSQYQELLQQFAELDTIGGSLGLDLSLGARLNPEGNIQLEIDGPVSLTGFTLAMPEVSLSNAALQFDALTRINFPASPDTSLLDVQGSLQLAGMSLALAQADLVATLDDITWNGLLTLTAVDDTSDTLLLDGTLALNGLHAELAARQLDGQLAAASWQGLVSTSAQGLSVQGSVSADQLALNHSAIEFELLTLNALALDNLVLESSGALNLPATSLQGLRLLGTTGGATAQNPDLFSLNELQAGDIQLDAARNISVASVTLRNPVANLVRNAQGGFNRIDPLLAAFGNTSGNEGDETVADATATGANTTAAENTETPATSFAIGELNINAENFLTFSDRSVTPPAAFKLGKLELALQDFTSPSVQPARVMLTVGNDSMNLSTQGSFNLLSDSPAADLSLTLSALDLPPLSSYLPGFNIERGRFNTTSTIKIEGEALSVQNSVLVERLQLSGKQSEEAGVLSRGMGMPLDAALALLRDSDDRITLSLPVTGSLSDPEFDISDILRTATQNALKNAALSYVKNALQPLGALMMLGNLASEAARPRFEPMAMEAGKAGLTATGREYLLKIGELLGQRPGLQLSICSVATAADREVLTSMALAALQQAAEEAAASQLPDQADAAETLAVPEQITVEISDNEMLQLAGSRTAEVINFLINEAGVARDRLFTCRETIENRAGDGPRTEITL